MSRIGAAPRTAVAVSNARAEASRKNGAKSRGPKTPEGKARSAQNALKHGLRAQKYVVLPEEDADEFAGLEAALVEELAPVGALQMVLARRVAVAAWRLARADRIEVELFAHRSWGADANPGLAMIRDGNGTRSFETLLRYRGRPWPSSGAHSRRSRRSRPRPWHMPQPKSRRNGPSRLTLRPYCSTDRPRPRSQTNPKAAAILVNQVDRVTLRIRPPRHACATHAPPASRPSRCRRRDRAR